MDDRVMVVKIGGAEGVDLESTCDDVASLLARSYRLILVHGGSGYANKLAAQLGHPPRFLCSPSGYLSRYTDRMTRDIFVRAAGALNDEIVSALRAHGVDVKGLVEPERCVLVGDRKRAIRAVVDGRIRVIRDDYSGRVTDVDTQHLRLLLEVGCTPVVPPLVLSEEDGLLNVDGDRIAAAIAGAMGAERLILLSNVPGLLRRFPEEGSLVHRVPREQLDRAMVWAQGRMKRKVLSVREALECGVLHAVVADGRLPHPIRQALAGGGTWFE